MSDLRQRIEPIRSRRYLDFDVGKRVQKLVAIERLPGSKVRCRCDCGNERIVRVGHFNAGGAISCGCTDFRRRTAPVDRCTIVGCESFQCNSHGYCWKHYTRWRRHGDPMHTPYGKAAAWLIAHQNHQGDECLTWPFGSSDTGYGQVTFEGVHILAHRQMCILVHGQPPSRRHQAAHACGNGHLGCVNPKHLRWATPRQNNADKLRHGTTNRGERSKGAKLTEEKVREIRERFARDEAQADIARMFAVTPGCVQSIVTGKTWAWLS